MAYDFEEPDRLICGISSGIAAMNFQPVHRAKLLAAQYKLRREFLGACGRWLGGVIHNDGERAAWKRPGGDEPHRVGDSGCSASAFPDKTQVIVIRSGREEAFPDAQYVVSQ